MKKVLALLTLSMLMIASLIIGVNATISDDDVGVYIRFDSQKTVEENAYGNTLVDVSFDAEKGALRATSLNPVGGSKDNNLFIKFNGASLDDYPYMRVTYWRPKTLRDGSSVNDTNASGCIFMNGADKTYYNGISFAQTDTWARKVLYWKEGNVSAYTAGTKINNARFDIPNDIAEGKVIEFYIYDVGFFKTAEAAYAYNPVQDYYLIDFTKDTTDMWASFDAGLKMEYNAENKETTFTQPMDSESHDGRATSKELSAIDKFSSHTYKYIAAKFKSNTQSYGAWFINYGVNTTTAGQVGLTDAQHAYGANGKTTIDSKFADGETWTVGYVNANDYLKADHEIMWKIMWDPINTAVATTMTEDLWRTFKYVAFYATEGEAKLAPQSAPEGITVTAPTAKDGKGTISGVTNDMEYRTSLKDAYTAIVTENGTMEADAGTTYYIRYKEIEGTYNPGCVTTVTVPIYWDLDITALKFGDGDIAVTSDKIVKTDKCNWTVTVPTGVDITKLVPVYTLTTGVSDKYTYSGAQKTRGINLYVNGNSAYSRKAVSGGFGDNFNENNEVVVKLLAEQALEEYITIKFVTEGGYNETEFLNTTANAILNKFRTVDGENVTITNYAHNRFLGKNEAEITTAIQEFATKIANRYTGITAAVTVSNFVEPTKGTIDKKEGTDGSFKVEVTLTSKNSSKTVTENLSVPAAHYRIILNFGSPILESSISYLGNPESATYLTGEMVENSTSLLGKNLKLVKHTTDLKNGEFNITFTPGDGVIPEIKQLADYPVIVYRHQDSRSGGRYQIYYYTDGYSGDHAYQDKAYNASETMTTNIYEVPFAGEYTGKDKTGKDTSWANKLTSIRFDFMRGNLQNGDTNEIWSEIDYIGLFATKAEAEEFVANATLDNANETQESIDAKYKTQVDALKAKEEENGKTVNASCEEFDLTNYDKFKASIKKYVNDYVKNTYFANDDDTVYYVAISDVVRPISGTEEKPLGTNGGCTFRIYFADSATNGYAASTGNDIKVNVLANDVLNVTTLGAQIRADKTDEVSLRFGVQVDKGGIITAVEKDKNLYENLGLETVDGVSNLKFGMLIIPEFALSDNSLTFANLTEKTIDYKTTYWLGDVEVANVQCKVIYDSKETDFTYTAVVYGITGKDTALVARPYAKYTVNGVDKVVYFDSVTRSYAGVKAAFETNSELGWDKD